MDVGTIKVRLAFDESSVDSAFADMKTKAKSFNSLLLTPTVDDRQLTALNKHLDLKIQHYKQVQRYFASNPLKITTSTSASRGVDVQRYSQGFMQSQQRQNQVELKLNSRGFEASFKSTTDSFLSRFAKTEIQLKNPKFNFMSLLTSPLKSFADEFTRETSRSFARGTGITKASNRAGQATGKFTVERGTEFADHAAKNLLMYEDGLKGLKKDIDIMSQAASNFLHPEPFYASLDKVETRFAKFLHDTFYGDGIGKAFNNVGADIENGIQAKLDKLKGLASIVNTNVAGEIKGLAGKSGKELNESIRNLSPEAKPLYEKLTTKARQVAIDEGITKKKDQAARVGQLLSNPESALKLSAEVAQDMMKESGAEGLLRPLNVLLRTFRVTTNSLRKMNAMELESIAESMVEQYKAIVPKVEEGKKQLVIYASAASDFGRGAEEHAPIIQAQFPGAQVVSPTFDEYDFKRNHESGNVFQNAARGLAKPLGAGLVAGGTNEGAEILSDTLSGYLFGYSKSVARIMATIQAALDQGYEMQDIQLVGFSQGSQVVRNAVDVMANLGQDVKGVGIGLADYLDALVPKNPNHQSFYAKEDSLNLPAQIGLVPSSGKEVQMNAMNTKVDGHALFQIASQPEFLTQMTEHGMKGVREGDYDAKAMSNHLLNYQRLIAPARTSQLIGNLIGGKDVGEGIASRPTDPYKRYKAVEDFDSLLSMLKGGANKILRDYSPKNLEETANKLGVKPDAEFLGVGNKLYIEYEQSVADLAQAMGIASTDIKSNLSGLELAGNAIASYRTALESSATGTLDLAQTQVSISELIKTLPNGDLKTTMSQLVVDMQSQGMSALEASKSNKLLSDAVRITSFRAKDEDFINDPRNPNQVPQSSEPIYEKSNKPQPLVSTPVKLESPMEIALVEVNNAIAGITDNIASAIDSVATNSVNSQLSRVIGQPDTVDISRQIDSISDLGAKDVLKLSILGIADTLDLFRSAVTVTYKTLLAVEQGAFKAIPGANAAKSITQGVAYPIAAYSAMSQFPVTGGMLDAVSGAVHGVGGQLVNSAASNLGGSASQLVGDLFANTGGIGKAIGGSIGGSLETAVSSAITSIGNLTVEAASLIIGGKGASEVVKAIGGAVLKDDKPSNNQKAIASSSEQTTKTLLQGLNDLVSAASKITAADPQKAQLYLEEAKSRALPQLQAAQEFIDKGEGKTTKGARVGGAKGNFSQLAAKIDNLINQSAQFLVDPIESLSKLVSEASAEPTGDVADYIDEVKRARTLFSQKLALLKSDGNVELAKAIQVEAERATDALNDLEAQYKRVGGMPRSLKTEVTATKKVVTTSSKQAKGIEVELVKADSLGEGLHNAMSQAAKDAYTDAQSIADAANKGFTDETEIKSPSRVWFRYGQYLLEGLSGGMSSLSILDPITAQIDAAADYLKNKASLPAPILQNQSITANANNMGYQGGQQVAQGINMGVDALNQGVAVAAPVVQQGIDIAGSGISGFLAGLNQQLEQLGTNIPGLDAVKTFFDNIQSIGTGLAAFTFLQTFQDQLLEFGQASFDAALQYESFTTLLNNTSSSSGAVAASLDTINSTVAKLNINLAAARDGYVKLQASSLGTELEGRPTDKIFGAVSQASSVYQLDEQSTERVYKAIEQMASKGTVSAEELRQQMGESLPGAFQIAARSMGLTTKEFNKLLETGQITSADFLPKFAAQLSAETNQGIAGAANSAQGSMNKLNNAILRLQETAGKPLLQGYRIGLGLLTPVVEYLPGVLTLTAAAVAMLGAQLLWMAAKPVTTAIAGLLKLATGATTVTGALRALTLQALKFGAWAGGATLALGGLQTAFSMLTDSGGKFGEWARQSKQDLKEIQDQAAKTRGEVSNLGAVTDKNVKNDGFAQDTIIGSIFGKDLTNAGEKFIQKNAGLQNLIPGVGLYNLGQSIATGGKSDDTKSGRTSANIKAENMAIQASEDIQAKNAILSSNITQFQTAKEVGRLNREIEQKQLQAKGFEMANPLETTAIRQQKEEIDNLIAARDKVNEPLAIQTQKNQSIIDSATNAIKELKEQMAAGKITTAQFENGLANYTSILRAGERDQKLFNDALDDSNKQFTNAGIAIAKTIAQLEDYMSNTDFNKLTRDARISMQQLNGGLTEGQAEYTKQLSDQVVLLQDIATKQQAIKKIKDEVGETNINEVLAAFGLKRETVGQSQLEEKKAQATTPQQKVALDAMSEILTLELDLAGMTGQYYDTANQLKQQITDTNKSIAEYFQQALEAFEDTKNAIAESKIADMATRAGNDIKRGVMKFKTSFVTSLVDSIISLIELTNKFALNAIKEKMDMSSAFRKFQQAQQQGNELGQGLVNGISAIGNSGTSQPMDTPTAYNAAPLTVYSGGRKVSKLSQVNDHHDYQTSKDGKGRMVVDIVLADSTGKQMGVGVPSPVSGTAMRRSEGAKKGYGNYVDILDDAGKLIARMAHLDKFIAKNNQRVNAGDIIGTQGNTGRSTGTHLHIEVAKPAMDSYIKMLTTGKGMSSGVPTYNRLDGSVGRRDGSNGATNFANSTTYKGGAIGGIAAKDVQEFARKTIQVANELGIKPEHLFGIMGAESGFRPKVVNQIGATGLIQFMPKTAEGLGTTTGKLKNMSGIEQLDWVKAFFKEQISRTGVDFRKTGIMGAYGAVFANDPFNKKGASVSDGQSTLAGTVRRAQRDYGSQIDQFMKAAGTVTQTQAKTASYMQSLTSAFPQPPVSKTKTPSTPNTSNDAQTGANQLQSAQSINTQTYNAEVAEARRQRLLADEDTRLSIAQERIKAGQAAVDASRQLQDRTLQRQREQEDANDSLGYSTPDKEQQIQLKNINRTFDDRNLKNRRDLEDLLNDKGALGVLIEKLKSDANLDPSGELLKKYQGVLVDINKDINSVNFDLSSSESNRQKAIADVVQKTDDIRIEQGKAFIGQMNEVSSQTLNAMADAAQKMLDMNPDDYSKGDPIDFRLQAQQQDLYLAFDESISNMQRMVRDGERTAEQASNYAIERKALLDADLANAVTASQAEKRAAIEARDARAKERVERLRETLANNEARNIEFNQELNSLSNDGINNQINSLRSSARNTPMSYQIDTANKMENDLKVAETINNTQAKLRELTLEQRENQNRLSEINRLTAIADKSPEQISQLQQLQVEQGSARSSEQIQKLIDLTQQLDAQTLDGLRQEFENIVTDRAKERLNNMIEIESNVFNSGQELLGAKSSYASTLGFGVNAQKYQKEAAINQQGFDFSAGLRGIEEFREKTGASADTVAQLKANLESLNEIKLKGIEAEFNPFTQVLGEVQQGVKSTVAGVLLGSQTLSEGLANAFNSITEMFVNLAIEWATNELFSSLFGMGGLGMGAQKAPNTFGGGGEFGLSSIAGLVFSGIGGFADGGEVQADPGINALRKLPGSIGKALTKEGSNSVLAALTPGERVLTIREARLYNALHPTGIANHTQMPQISNFATGGMVNGVTQGSYANMGNTTVNVPVTIEGGNSDNIDGVAIASAVRKAVLSEMATQTRPNGMLNKRR